MKYVDVQAQVARKMGQDIKVLALASPPVATLALYKKKSPTVDSEIEVTAPPVNSLSNAPVPFARRGTSNGVNCSTIS